MERFPNSPEAMPNAREVLLIDQSAEDELRHRRERRCLLFERPE